jgi:hypothetical protein
VTSCAAIATMMTITTAANSLSQGDVAENETALSAISWLFAAAADASISSCLLQVCALISSETNFCRHYTDAEMFLSAYNF